jgi:hypothetical protein
MVNLVSLPSILLCTRQQGNVTLPKVPVASAWQIHVMTR